MEKNENLTEEKEVSPKKNEEKHFSLLHQILAYLVLPVMIAILFLPAWYKEGNPFKNNLVAFLQPFLPILGIKFELDTTSLTVIFMLIWTIVVSVVISWKCRKQFKKNKK